MPTLEQVLKDAQALPPEDQRLLSELLEPPRSLEELAAGQGIGPFDFEAARQEADFWPEAENVDDFIATIRQWRREDNESEAG